MTTPPPSRNLALDGSLLGVFRLFQDKMLQNTDDMLPAQVIAFDRTTNRAQVQPLIQMVDTLGNLITRGQIASIPVLQIGGGGFVISVPLQTGDLGWIKANDRDISLFKQTLAQSAPNTSRKHNFSDAVFIPDSFMKGVSINAEDSGNLVIQNLAGTVRIAIWDDKVKITAPTVVIDSPTTTCTGDLIVDGNVTIDETLSVTGISTLTGDVEAQGNLTVDTDLVVDGTADINGIPFATHRHGGVQTGSGDTGVPI